MKTKRPVIFRADANGNIVAIFPDEPYSLAGDSYDARTIHGQTQVGFEAYYTLRPATPREYMPLFAAMGSDYRLCKRVSWLMRETYDAELRFMRAEWHREGDGFGLPDDWDWRDLYEDSELNVGYADRGEDCDT